MKWNGITLQPSQIEFFHLFELLSSNQRRLSFSLATNWVHNTLVDQKGSEMNLHRRRHQSRLAPMAQRGKRVPPQRLNRRRRPSPLIASRQAAPLAPTDPHSRQQHQLWPMLTTRMQTRIPGKSIGGGMDLLMY
jgi:hypothetical protein